LVGTTKAYSGVGADIVMESFHSKPLLLTHRLPHPEQDENQRQCRSLKPKRSFSTDADHAAHQTQKSEPETETVNSQKRRIVERETASPN